METVYGPLGQEYCMYFYFLEIYFFVSLVLFLGFNLYNGIVKRKPAGFYFSKLIMASVIFLMYFQNRLLYSMCARK